MEMLMPQTPSSKCMWYRVLGSKVCYRFPMSLVPIKLCPFMDMRALWFLSEHGYHWIKVLPNSKIHACMIMYKSKHITQQSSQIIIKTSSSNILIKTLSSKHRHQNMVPLLNQNIVNHRPSL